MELGGEVQAMESVGVPATATTPTSSSLPEPLSLPPVQPPIASSSASASSTVAPTIPEGESVPSDASSSTNTLIDQMAQYMEAKLLRLQASRLALKTTLQDKTRQLQDSFASWKSARLAALSAASSSQRATKGANRGAGGMLGRARVGALRQTGHGPASVTSRPPLEGSELGGMESGHYQYRPSINGSSMFITRGGSVKSGMMDEEEDRYGIQLQELQEGSMTRLERQKEAEAMMADVDAFLDAQFALAQHGEADEDVSADDEECTDYSHLRFCRPLQEAPNHVVVHVDECDCPVIEQQQPMDEVTDSKTDASSMAVKDDEESSTSLHSLHVHSCSDTPTAASTAAAASSASVAADTSVAIALPSPTVSPDECSTSPYGSSTLHSDFIVALPSPDPPSTYDATSPELFDPCLPFPQGFIPKAPPLSRCHCAFPWRSVKHLESMHLIAKEHARDIMFEGSLYRSWRGGFYANGEPRSILRGVLHELAFVITLIYAIPLLLACTSWVGLVAACINLASQFLLYGTSSQFHRRNWTLHTYNRLKRMDHSAIFFLCAGQSTPTGILLIRIGQLYPDRYPGTGMETAGWCLIGWAFFGALTGTLHSMLKKLSGHVSSFGLIWMGIVGACMVPFVYHCYLVMSSLEFGTLITAWLIYFLGSLTYSRRWFDIWPDVFGYHDAFHAMTILGGVFAGIFNYSICSRLT